MNDPDQPGIDPALFDRLWDELHKPTYYMGMRVFPFDAQEARRERFIPLKLLLYWLDTLPHPKGCLPDLGLFGLARRHIRVGHLKTYGPSWRTTTEIVEHEPDSVEVIENGKVIGQARVAELIAIEKEEPDNPLIDVHDFATWFREVSPEYLRLPAGFPGSGSEAEAEGETVTIGVPLEGPEEWPTIQVLAAAFDGLNGWGEDQWQSNLGGGNRSPWIMDHLNRPGKGGRGQYIRAHPVNLALGIIDKVMGAERQVVLSRLDAVFSRGELAAWRPHWMAARPKTIRP